MLDGRIGPTRAPVLTRLFDKIPCEALTETQPALIEVAAIWTRTASDSTSRT